MPTELQEALTAANSVTALIQKQIDPMLLEYQRRYAPWLRAIKSKQWGSTQYFVNRRTARPRSGGVVDGGARPIGNSTYEQASFNIKLFQAVGSVTGFAQTVTRDLIGDLRQTEIDGTVTSMLWTVENCFVWGHDGATAAGQYPICTGLDYQVANFAAGTGSNNYINALEFAPNGVGTTFALKYLDEIIDMVATNVGRRLGPDWMFLMSPRMASAVSQVLVNQQRFMAPDVEVAAGLNVPSYRNIPIIESSFLSPRSVAMGAVTPSTATTGGTLAAATYRYSVSAVVEQFGETLASPEVTQTTTGSTSANSLAFSTPTNFPEGALPMLYKVYRSTGGAGTPVFIGTVDAYDTTGAATTTIIDTGTALLTNSAGNTGAAQSAAYQGVGAGGVLGNMYARLNTATLPVEDIYLIPLDGDFLCRPYTRDMLTIPLAPTVSAPDTLPFAIVTDTTLAIRGPKYVGRGHGLVSYI